LLRAAEIIRSGAARILRLSEFKIADAMRIYTDTHNVTEGAGAAPLAGLIRERQRCSGKRAAVICSGSTIDAPVFAEILAGRTPAA
jgi:threonine dehydratase